MAGDRPPSRVRAVAWAGVASLLPYTSIKTYWACGGTAGKPAGLDLATEFARNGAPPALVWLERHGVDFTAVLALLGAALLLTLARARLTGPPRRALLATAWAGAALLTPYGLLTAWAALSGHHPGGQPDFSPWITVAGVLAFCGTGTCLAGCARCCQLSRPRRPAGGAGRHGQGVGASPGRTRPAS